MSFNKDSVQLFNALPRNPRAPSGRVPNTWHFDLRYVPLEPTPGHLLFIVQIESSYIYTERLPLGLPSRSSGVSFFPETGGAAAPEVCKGLIHAFLDGFGEHKFERNPSPPFAPWKFTTEDSSLAAAVGTEFKRLGVRKELCKIEVVKGKPLDVAHQAFSDFWDGLKKTMGITGIVAATLTAPNSIVFRNLQLAKWVGDAEADDDTKALAYIQRLTSTRPLSMEDPHLKTGDQMLKDLNAKMELFDSVCVHTLSREADAGNAEAAIDYALRLQFGIGCTPSRDLFHYYLNKVIDNPNATAAVKSRAHALLIEWYTGSSTDSLYYRYLHAAAHHANESALLSNGDVSASILFFAMYTLEPRSHQVLELCVQYKAVWAALEKRKKEIEKQKGMTERKRAQDANRYICAAVNCYIQGDKGAMLKQCSGKCDPDKKPAYCSKECQRADWKTHKPYCRPGAPCSVLEKDHPVPVAAGKATQGSLSIPVTRPGGETVMVSSSTLGPETLKQFKDWSEARGSRSMGSFRVECVPIGAEADVVAEHYV
ncbi:hypothetical protein Hypma_009049 [Hypsizygus marmoreus]|uniref:MYND-type domain-containing protein n=1 Tax=Hypsizygus marmoreus TaxID=39966 RepID=A0A369JNZ2_HYPMA|nr:hypothetical protein Hypma_009049 [Hypsizygus marmoreus]